MQLDQRIDEFLPDPGTLGLGQELREIGSDHCPVDPLHQIERCPDDLRVVARNDRLRTARHGSVQPGQHGVLATDIVSRWEERSGRWSSQDVALIPTRDEERLVRMSGLVALNRERNVVAEMPVEERLQRRTVHQLGHARPPVAGFVPPPLIAALSTLRAMTIR